MPPAVSTSFSHAMTLHPVTPSSGSSPEQSPAGPVYAGELNLHWTIGPKIHGGVMVSLCAKAAQLAWCEGSAGGSGGTAALEPVAVSANFLWAPDPGTVELSTTVRKRGRRIGVIDVELRQGERTAVRATITLGVPEHDVPPLLAVNPALSLMSPEPPPELAPIGPGHPLAEINHLAAGADIRPDLTGVLHPTEGAAPITRIWVRPRGEAPDALFALTCGDISTPITFAVGRTGWAPTVQLTAYLRGAPADGWLRVVCSGAQIGQDWFDEDHTVVDSAGRIVVQTRQLALVPVP